MFKRITLTLIAVAAFTVGAWMPNMASAEWGRGHHGHVHHGHYGHHGHTHWSHRPVLYPPIYVGSYYPVRTYYANPYWYPYYPGYYGRSYYGYYGSGVNVSFGW